MFIWFSTFFGFIVWLPSCALVYKKQESRPSSIYQSISDKHHHRIISPPSLSLLSSSTHQHVEGRFFPLSDGLLARNRSISSSSTCSSGNPPASHHRDHHEAEIIESVSDRECQTQAVEWSREKKKDKEGLLLGTEGNGLEYN